MIWVFGIHVTWLFMLAFASEDKQGSLITSVLRKARCVPVNKLFPTTFHLRSRDHFNLSSATADQESKIFGNHLKPDKDVVVIVHEYLRGCDKPFTKDTIKAYLKARPKVQLINVCWSAGFTSLEQKVGMTVGAAVGYAPSTTLVPCVGDLLAQFLKRIHQESHIDWDRITLVAHSLGSQLSGDAGNKVGGKLGKIIALDPATPFYGYSKLTKSLLNPKSAKHVIVLHTARLQYSMGTADFYANSEEQPGCERHLESPNPSLFEFWKCIHSRSFQYYIESVLNPHAFPARKCASYDKVKDGKCENKNSTYFGPDTEVIGFYYFKTKPKEPYY
uniref:Lipase domain-containing protein n=1 Tax=Lygus hesperus TaxID=30085 RepID=A0A0A9XPT0_LYGHE